MSDTKIRMNRLYESDVTIEEIREIRNALSEFCKKDFKKEIHYGSATGPEKSQKDRKEKPALLLPGAQYLAQLFCLIPAVTEEQNISERPDGTRIVSVDTTTTFKDHNGNIRGLCRANCNSSEKQFAYQQAKFKWVGDKYIDEYVPEGQDKSEFLAGLQKRKAGKGDFQWMEFRVSNTAEVIAIKNTIQKVSAKRSYVGAVLMATATSEFFAADTEAHAGNGGATGEAGDDLAGAKKQAKELLDQMDQSGDLTLSEKNTWTANIEKATGVKMVSSIIASLKSHKPKVTA